MLHLTKLAVGIRDLQHLRSAQAERLAREKRLRHRTRNFPRRADEILSGGSMFWVIGGFTLARQPLLDIVEERWPDRPMRHQIGTPRRRFAAWRHCPRHFAGSFGNSVSFREQRCRCGRDRSRYACATLTANAIHRLGNGPA
jgi:hypothetical protein